MLMLFLCFIFFSQADHRKNMEKSSPETRYLTRTEAVPLTHLSQLNFCCGRRSEDHAALKDAKGHDTVEESHLRHWNVASKESLRIFPYHWCCWGISGHMFFFVYLIFRLWLYWRPGPNKMLMPRGRTMFQMSQDIDLHAPWAKTQQMSLISPWPSLQLLKWSEAKVSPLKSVRPTHALEEARTKSKSWQGSSFQFPEPIRHWLYWLVNVPTMDYHTPQYQNRKRTINGIKPGNRTSCKHQPAGVLATLNWNFEGSSIQVW
jgi:hypothetical protein